MSKNLNNTELSKFISNLKINQLEIPSSKEEDWRFTNLNFLKKKHDKTTNHSKTNLKIDNTFKSKNKNQLYIENNILDKTFSDINIEGVDIIDMNTAINKYPKIFKNYFSKIYPFKNDYFCSENLLSLKNGIFVYIEQNTNSNIPIELLFANNTTKQVVPRIFIYCCSNAKLSFIERYISLDDSKSFTNSITEIFLEENSKIEYFKIQTESNNATHFSGLGILQEKNSIINCHTFTEKTGFTRNNILSKLNGTNSECHLNGLSIGSESNFIDNHSIIQHSAPHSISSELYKGIYTDSSKGVFDGKIVVDENAVNIDSEQLNSNILLSKSASVNSNPRLEINTDEVTCKHGSTIGQLDDEPLFYLKSRGCNHETAQQILLNGFCNEFVENIDTKEIQEDFNEHINNYISKI